MYSVSQDFMQAMAAPERHVLARVVIDYAGPFIDAAVTITASEQANVSHPEQTADGVEQVPCRWACLDGSWVLDGSYHLAPLESDLAMYQVGWWGSQLAGEGGAFSAPYPALTVTFLPRPIHSLRVVGDSAYGEYPVDFTIRLYDGGDTLLHERQVTGNTQLAWGETLSSPVTGVAKMVLEVSRWSHPGRQVKIAEFYTSVQETYESGQFLSLKLLEEREITQGSLPVGNISANEITITLANEGRKFDPENTQSPLYGALKPNRRIRAWLGTGDEWVPLGTFWSVDWDVPDDSVEATARARDRLELLRKGTYQSAVAQQNVSLYSLAEQVLQDAGLQPEEYAIDTALQSIVVPWAWFNPTTHREALRVIAEAGLAVVFCDRDGVVRVQRYASGLGSAPCLAIGPDNYFVVRTPSRQDQVANEIVVDTQPLQPAAQAQEVYRSNSPATVPAGGSVTVRVYYNQPPVIEASASLDSPPSGVSITSTTYFGWGAEVTVANTGQSDAQVTIVVTGRPFTQGGRERAIARDEESIAENGVLRYEFPANPLVQTLGQAQAIADALLASVKDPRRDVELEWRGNPALLLGDRVTVKNQDYYVIRQEIEWAGALSARLTGRKAS